MSKKTTPLDLKLTPAVEEPAKSLTLPAKIVVVKWEDIQSETGWSEDLDPEPPVFNTVGYLVTKTKRKVVICDTVPGNGTITVFPSGCILEIKEIGTLTE